MDITPTMIEAAAEAIWSTWCASEEGIAASPLSNPLSWPELVAAGQTERFPLLRNLVALSRLEAENALRAGLAEFCRLRPLDDYYDDLAPALWWKFPIEEAPWCGRPGDSDWPGYHTHFTLLPPCPTMPAQFSNLPTKD